MSEDIEELRAELKFGPLGNAKRLIERPIPDVLAWPANCPHTCVSKEPERRRCKSAGVEPLVELMRIAQLPDHIRPLRQTVRGGRHRSEERRVGKEGRSR